MGWLVETWLMNEDKEHFTGNMTEFTTEAGAKEEAEAEAKRIGDALGLPVLKAARTVGPFGDGSLVLCVGEGIEIRCKENKR